VNYLVLGVAMLMEGYSFSVALREFQSLHQGEPFWQAIRASKDPSVFAVLLEDAAALAGLLVALAGVGLSQWLELPILDGAASIVIGLLLVATAIFLARETLSLLTGESATRRSLREVKGLLLADTRVAAVDEMLSMQLGPREVLLAVTIDFRAGLGGEDVETAAAELTVAVERLRPEITWLFMRPRRLAT
jgi:divalent metal cation (Fe/Co/Zn/Cd) transporter